MSTPTRFLRSVCPQCDGSGLVPGPDRPWWAFWRIVDCPECRGAGHVSPRGIVIDACTFAARPEDAVGPTLPKSHPNRVKPSPPDDDEIESSRHPKRRRQHAPPSTEGEPEPERRRCPNCRFPLD